MAEESQISPPWGALPVEQHLIRNWDRYPDLPAPQRRERLVRDFLALDPIPREWDGVRQQSPYAPPRPPPDLRQPTADEIETVLRPWRPESVRAAAARAWGQPSDQFSESLWVRTHYDAGQDGAWEELVADGPDEHTPDNALSEPALFAQCDGLRPEAAWVRALLWLPELASRGSKEKYDRRLLAALEDAPDRDAVREELREGPPTRGPPGDWPNVGSFIATKRLQLNFTEHNVAIADAETFETGKLCALALDVRGNVVRWFRVTPEELSTELDTYSNEAMLDESGWMEEVEGVSGVGEKYDPAGGEFADLVYGLRGDDEEAEDD